MNPDDLLLIYHKPEGQQVGTGYALDVVESKAYEIELHRGIHYKQVSWDKIPKECVEYFFKKRAIRKLTNKKGE
jgi:hypothetical protein